VALNKGDLVSAVAVSDEILKTQANNREGLLCKGRALGASGKYGEALSTLELAEKQSQPGFDKIIATIFIGNLHKDNKKNVEAIASYEKSLKICESEKNDKFKRINLNLIGESQAANKDYNAALSSYLAGAKLAMNDNERADGYERLASTYGSLGQYDSAIEYQLKGVLMQQKSGTLDQYANASLALGQIYVQAKDYVNAENTYSKLIQFAKDNGGVYYESKASYGLAQTKAMAGDSANAKTIMSDALTLAKNSGERDLAAEIEASLNKLNN
jgi:tetratricopeptide (TPR) repeat protein